MAKAATAQATVTLKHLAAALAETHEMAKKQSELILNDLVGLVTKHLKKGDRIRLVGLGILAGAQARRPHGPQSCHRRADQDQGQQEGRLSRRQGAQGSRLIFPLEGMAGLLGHWFRQPQQRRSCPTKGNVSRATTENEPAMATIVIPLSSGSKPRWAKPVIVFVSSPSAQTSRLPAASPLIVQSRIGF